MGKKRRGKEKQRRPDIPPIVGLRSFLDDMFSHEEWAELDVEALQAQLDSALAGQKPQEALPVLLRSYQQAPERVRGMSFLIDHNPPWEGATKDIATSPPIHSAGFRRAGPDRPAGRRAAEDRAADGPAGAHGGRQGGGLFGSAAGRGERWLAVSRPGSPAGSIRGGGSDPPEPPYSPAPETACSAATVRPRQRIGRQGSNSSLTWRALQCYTVSQ